MPKTISEVGDFQGIFFDAALMDPAGMKVYHQKKGRRQRQRLQITPQKNDCELFAQRSELIKRGYGLS